MITLRRAQERRHDRRRRQEAWRTFYPQGQAGPLADGFGAIELFNEDRLPPGASVPRRPHHDAEVVTYVREGALAYDDSAGRSGVVYAGEFRRIAAARGVRHGEANASSTEWAHVFQVWLRPPPAGLERGQEQKRFSSAERRGVLRVVASPDARGGSLYVCQDALIYSAVLGSGQHMVHELARGRGAWLHLVKGEVSLGDLVLTGGDGAGVTGDRAVSFTARAETEVLLVDLGELPPGPSAGGPA